VTVRTHVLVAGTSRGELVRLTEPLSLWGGLDPSTGLVIDQRHPQHGVALRERIVVMPHGRGSSSSSSVLAESLRAGTGPAALVLEEPDPILVVGVLVARYLYDIGCPVVVGPVPEAASGVWEIDLDGTMRPVGNEDLIGADPGR
jgi:uncharacterized protein